MLGKRSDQRGPWEAHQLYLDLLGRDTFYGPLASLRGKLFRDADFAELYCPDNGRASVAPRVLASALLLQARDKVSDAEAKGRADFDIRLKVALGIEVEERPLRITALLKCGEAGDADEFRRRDRIHQEWSGLNATTSNALEQMQRISGPGDALEALRTTPDGLASEEDSSRLRLDRHRLSEELQGHARDWAVRTIAESLIRRAQSKFERERPPDEIRHAERSFLDATDGAYQGVYSPMDSSEINVRDATGNTRTPEQLSRGTREQLFLALRFGMILEMGQHSERLPVIVDEALVNFDPARGTRAAASFIDLSETNQVLVFTCHPQIVDWFVDAATERGVGEPEVMGI